MKQIAQSKAKQVNDLHLEIMAIGKTMIDKAIEIGGILSEIKGELKHGEWMPWVKDNLPFGIGQAQRYMKAYRYRDQLNASSETHLTAAMKALAEPRGKREHLSSTEAMRFIPVAGHGLFASVGGADLFVVCSDKPDYYFASFMRAEWGDPEDKDATDGILTGITRPISAQGVKAFLEHFFSVDELREAHPQGFAQDEPPEYPWWLFDSEEEWKESVIGLGKSSDRKPIHKKETQFAELASGLNEDQEIDNAATAAFEADAELPSLDDEEGG